MKITAIAADRETLTLCLYDAPQGQLLRVLCRAPIVCGDDAGTIPAGRVVAQYDAACRDGAASIPRFSGDYDCLICAFEALADGEPVPGVRYVTDFDPAASDWADPYPQRNIKALGCTPEDVDVLGIQQSSLGPNQATLMTLDPTDAIEFIYNGKPYYFKRKAVEEIDKQAQALAQRDVMCVMRYINAPYIGTDEIIDEKLIDIILHPGHDNDYPSAYISAFNVRTEEGLDYFCAYTEFLVARYARKDRKYGWALSFEVGNEVTSQYIWNNAGEMTCKQYMKEYTTVMRLAWLLASKHYANFRVHTSFDQYFTGRHVPEQPKRFYGMRECIDAIAEHCADDGDFPWNIAFHPYPENLSYPDFYHDREPNWTFETRRITFKNVEVMPAYLAQEHLLYKGQPRRIILPEQGFNTRDGEPYSEQEAAHAYVLAYLKIRRLGTIDMFLHHNYMDGPWEFGLNLGVRRFGGYDENHRQIPGEPKPTYWVMRDMDTPAEPGRVEAARAFIGPELFDYMLNPPAVIPARDHSRDGLGLMRPNPRAKKDTEQQSVQRNFDT